MRKRKEYNVPTDVLLHYISIVKRQVLIKDVSLGRYIDLDKERKIYHDKLLLAANTTRDDFDFQYWLAIQCENDLTILKSLLNKEGSDKEGSDKYEKIFGEVSE